MKKMMFALPVIAILAMSSCKKDYTCTCITKNTDTSVVTFEIEQDFSFKSSKGKSEGMCQDYVAKQNTEYGTDDDVTTTCTLK